MKIALYSTKGIFGYTTKTLSGCVHHAGDNNKFAVLLIKEEEQVISSV